MTNERDQLAATEILTVLAEAGVSGSRIGPDQVNERVDDHNKVGAKEFVAVARWLEAEGIIRLPFPVHLENGNFMGATLTAAGFKLVDRPSPIDPKDNLHTALVKDTEPAARIKIAEFIGSVIGSATGGFLNSQG